MSRGHQTPKWWIVVEAIEGLQDMRKAHRADGEVTPEEDAIESSYIISTLLPAAVDSADCQSLAQAIARGGPESGYAQRMLTSRARRKGFTARLSQPVEIIDAAAVAAIGA